MMEVTKQANSTSQAAFGIKKMRAFECDIPSLQEQIEIGRLVKILFAYTDQIEQKVKHAELKVKQSTQSILAKAFRGELTAEWRTQNHDLISGENSAEALLKTIQADRFKINLKCSSRVKKGIGQF
jgi:type I restriction enzyme S subunit